MRLPRPATTVLAAALLALLAGCGDGGDDTTTTPADFAISVDHADGSVPPPHHAVWRLEVDDTGQGVLAYTPDYPGPDVPTWRAEFDVAATAVDDLYAALRRQDLLGELEPTSDEPVGGPVETATVTADGKTNQIPAFTDGGAPLAPLAREIHALVPVRVWRNFEERRDAYAERRYGESP
jgi:hypothetical protein